MSVIYDPEYQIFIDCMKDYRMRSNMTQQELASVLGCSQSYISKYEHCQKRLDIVETRRICRSLSVALLDLIADYEAQLKKEGL